MFIPIFICAVISEADSGLYVAKASNGPDSSTCSAQLVVRESKWPFQQIGFFFGFHSYFFTI